MIGLDTNILVRYLVQDDAVQSAVASDIIENSLSEDDPGFVCCVAIVELVWVLTRSYGQSADQVAHVIARLLAARTLCIQHEAAVFMAMVALRSGGLSFADGLLMALGRSAGVSVTVTFDRKAARHLGFELAV